MFANTSISNIDRMWPLKFKYFGGGILEWVVTVTYYLQSNGSQIWNMAMLYSYCDSKPGKIWPSSNGPVGVDTMIIIGLLHWEHVGAT